MTSAHCTPGLPQAVLAVLQSQRQQTLAVSHMKGFNISTRHCQAEDDSSIVAANRTNKGDVCGLTAAGSPSTRRPRPSPRPCTREKRWSLWSTIRRSRMRIARPGSQASFARHPADLHATRWRHRVSKASCLLFLTCPLDLNYMLLVFFPLYSFPFVESTDPQLDRHPRHDCSRGILECRLPTVFLFASAFPS